MNVIGITMGVIPARSGDAIAPILAIVDARPTAVFLNKKLNKIRVILENILCIHLITVGYNSAV